MLADVLQFFPDRENAMRQILIADSHNICREALCSYLKHVDQCLSVEGFADVGQLAFRLKSGDADLVIVEHELPGWSDLTAAKTAVIVRSVDESIMFDPALHGVFSRNLSCKAFLGGVQDILAGGTFFRPEEEIAEVPQFSFKPSPQDFGLTAREKEVLSYLVKGQSNKDIARALDLQVVTVKLHVRGICRKMKAANRTQAALTAKENGWS